MRLAPRLRPAPGGFTLLSVLVALFVLAVGLLGILRTFVGVTAAATQNETMGSLATLSNTFWAAVQYTPQATLTGSFPGTYNLAQASTITSAPSELQPFLTLAEQTLPVPAQAVISVNSASCTTNCQITLALSWTQAGSPGSPTATTRTQTFFYALP